MRGLSFLLIILMTISAGLAACGQSGEKNGGTAADSQDTTTDSTSVIKEAEEEAEKAGDDAVEKTEELHQEQLSRLEKKAPEEMAKELWKLIETEQYKINWKQHKAEGATDESLVTYLNPIAEKALESKTTPLPPGSIIVEEQYDTAKELKTINAVINLGGQDPEGGWFYAQYSHDGKILKAAEMGQGMSAPH